MVVDNAWDDFVFLVSYKYNRVSRNGKKSITTHHFSFCRNTFLSLLLPSSIQNPLSVDSQYDTYCRLLILVLLCSSLFSKNCSVSVVGLLTDYPHLATAFCAMEAHS